MDLSYTSQIPTTEFIERRQNLLSQMKENTAAIIFFTAQEQFAIMIVTTLFAKTVTFGI